MKEKGWGQGHNMVRALLNHQKVKKWTKVRSGALRWGRWD